MANRTEKYPDTDFFHYYNANARNRITGDCVARAVATAFGNDYNETVKTMCDFHCETGYEPAYDVARFMEWLGLLKHRQLRHADDTKYTLKEFILEHPTGVYIVNMAHHLTAVVNGRCYDTWDCTKTTKRVGNFWKVK